MIQQGIIEIDYKDHSHLKINELSQRVLKGERRPANMDDFMQVHGVGDFKAKSYGERFLGLINSLKF